MFPKIAGSYHLRLCELDNSYCTTTLLQCNGWFYFPMTIFPDNIMYFIFSHYMTKSLKKYKKVLKKTNSTQKSTQESKFTQKSTQKTKVI